MTHNKVQISDPAVYTKKRIMFSSGSQVVGQLIGAITGIVILKITTNSLGLNGYGIFATLLAFVSSFALLTDLGLNAITAREIAKSPNEADTIISHNMGLRLFLCLIVVPIIYGLSFLFYPHAHSGFHLGMLLLSVYLFFDAIRSVSLAYFTSKVRNEISALVASFQQFFQLALVALAAALHWQLIGFILVFIMSNVLSAGMALYFARKEVRVFPRVNIARWKRIMAMSFSLGLLQVINMMYLKADSIILSVMKGATAVGIYGIAYSMILSLMMLPSFIMTALIPSMATATSKSIVPLVQKAYHYMVVLACLLAVGSFLVRNDIVAVVSSKDFAKAATPFAILAVASAFSYVNTVFGYASVSLNKHHKMTYSALGALVLNIILNFILIPKYSFNGAAIATAISEIFALFVAYVIFRYETKISIKLFIPFAKAFIAATLTLLLVNIMYNFYSTANHLINLIITSVFVVVAYVLSLALIKGLPEDVYELAIVQKILRRESEL